MTLLLALVCTHSQRWIGRGMGASRAWSARSHWLLCWLMALGGRRTLHAHATQLNGPRDTGNGPREVQVTQFTSSGSETSPSAIIKGGQAAPLYFPEELGGKAASMGGPRTHRSASVGSKVSIF